MIKTSKLTKTVYNTNPTHSQPINFYTPSTTSSSGSVCETEPSSISSSYRSNIGISDDSNHLQQDDSLITLIDKLKRELAAVKQAKSQLATLYKVSSMLFLFSIKDQFLSGQM
jgi:BRCT domain type II-containing protein